MSSRDIEIRTCSNSLLNPGACCFGMCEREATAAVLYGDLVEHARCSDHDHEPSIQARKTLAWSAIWGPFA